MDMLAQGFLQTPNFVEAESRGIGLQVGLVAGGFTPNTGWRIQIPPESAATTFYRTKKFTLSATPTDNWAFGFPVNFNRVNIAVGKQDIIFWKLIRNGLTDVQLELGGHPSGHELRLVDSNGITQDVVLNPFTDNADHWIEVFGSKPIMSIRVDDDPVLDALGDYEGDATGDQEASFEFRGQADLSPDANSTTFEFGPWYAADNTAGAGDLLDKTGHEVYVIRHIDATADKGCDENAAFPGSAEDLILGVWSDAADDDLATFGQYTGDGATNQGSAKEMNGPAPNYRPRDLPTGCKYLFITVGDRSGTYKVGHGARAQPTSGSYQLTTLGVADRKQFTEIWGLPGSGTFPAVPSEGQVAAMGHFVEQAGGLGKKLKLAEAYFVVFGPQGMRQANWPVKLVQREHMCRGLDRGINRGIGR